MKFTIVEIVILLIQITAIFGVLVDIRIKNKFLNRILPFLPLPAYILISILTTKFSAQVNIFVFLLIIIQLIVSFYNESKKSSKHY